MSGFIFAIAGTFLFSLKPIVIKYAYEAALTSEQIIALRMLFSLPFYLIVGFLAWRRKPARQTAVKQHVPKILILGVLGYFIASYLDILGLQYISAQLERIVLFCFPIMVVVLSAIFFKTPLPKNIGWLLGLSYAGILLIFGHDLTTLGNNVTAGTLLVFIGALCFSVYVLWGKPIITLVGSQLFTSIAMAGASFAVLALFLVTQPISNLVVSPHSYFIILLLAIVCTVIPSLLVAEGINRIGPEQTSIVGTFGPAATSVFAVYLLDEPFTGYHFAGLSLVIAAIVLMLKSQYKKR